MNMPALFVATSITFGAVSAAHAQRSVIVNGQRLSAAQIVRLERLNCARIPNGRYWVDTRSGAWGYAHSRVQQGYIGQYCGGGNRRKSLSERRQLYRPGEILGGW